jgi:hypothetical protein
MKQRSVLTLLALPATSQLQVAITPSFLSSGVVTVRLAERHLARIAISALMPLHLVRITQFNMAVQKVGADASYGRCVGLVVASQGL